MGDRVLIFLFILSLFLSVEKLAAQGFRNTGHKFGIGIGSTSSIPYSSAGTKAITGITIRPTLGFKAGPQIHYGFSSKFCDNIALRGAINFTHIRYQFHIEQTGFDGFNSSVILNEIEVPILFSLSSMIHKLYFVREYLGFSVNFPDGFNKVFTSEGDNGTNTYQYVHSSGTTSEIVFKFVSGVSLEWKTKTRGLFNVGAFYHIGFKSAVSSNIVYNLNDLPYFQNLILRGSYLTIEMKYFFRRVPIICPEIR